MKTQEQFDLYFNQVQKLAARFKWDRGMQQQILLLIEREKMKAYDDPPYSEFLLAEHDFYSGHYQKALKRYLNAKSIPHYKLFCFRTSAQISKDRAENAKALNFAREAYAIYQDDYITLSLLSDLLELNSLSEESLKIREKIQQLETQHSLETLNVSPVQESNNFSTEVLPMEPSMHTPQGFLTFPENDSTKTEDLTNRLYDLKPISSAQFSFLKTSADAFAGLKCMELGTPDTAITTTATATLPPPVKHNPTFENAVESDEQAASLEKCIQSFKKRQESCIGQYLEQLKRRPLSNDHCLYVLHGYPSSTNSLSSENALATELLLTDKDRRTSGGYYLRWNGKGIVINPGMNFLEHFHRQGLHVRDIDYVIVTNANPESHSDIKEIYDLNYQLNNANTQLQIIHYYLSQKAYQTLSPVLKPNFKQERNTVHCMELFLDSPDVEKIEIGYGITVNYFPITHNGHLNDLISKNEKAAPMPATLGLRIDLKSKDNLQEQKSLRLGYISGASWSPLLAHHLGQCDVLIAGFGSTNTNDYSKLKYNSHSLGYFGSYSLLEEVHPHLFLSSEFNGNEGDIRIEVIKLMRQEYNRAYPNARQIPAILPADPTLFIDLYTLNIQCSITKAHVAPSQVRIIKSQASFGNLRYLSPVCCT